MATYRYARESRTSAQTEARKWQVKVDMANYVLGVYTQIATRRELTAFEARELKRAETRLARLLDNNPNEAA